VSIDYLVAINFRVLLSEYFLFVQWGLVSRLNKLFMIETSVQNVLPQPEHVSQ
jgi:hypothetical protein